MASNGFSCVSRALFTLGVLVPLGTTACRNDTTGKTEVTAASANARQPAVPTPPSATAEPQLRDADIARAIERDLKEEPFLRSFHLEVVVTKGVARLTGSVTNLLARERAVRVAETIRGVRSVVDDVDVTPVSRTDAELEHDVKLALLGDAATARYTIGVAAKSGTVMLTGTADSWQEKQIIDEVAKCVPGLRALVNAMTVDEATVRPESDIATDVRSRIGNDAWLDGDTIVVEVVRHERTPAFPHGGITVVELAGTVGSLLQKNRARADAFVAGVDEVDDNGVTVDWFAENDRTRAAQAPVKSDPEIARAVRDAFRYDPRLRGAAPDVEVHDGEVVLTGTVQSSNARRAAAADAKDTLGVWRVRDELLVGTSLRPSDAEIRRAVTRILGAELPLPDARSIHVSSTNGRVTLRGAIPSGLERLDAVEEAESVPGVSEVEDDLSVTGPPVDVATRIEDRLFWDPRVEHDLIKVTVAPDGVATLTGTVHSWGEIPAARDDAIRAGATRVVNALVLDKRAL